MNSNNRICKCGKYPIRNVCIEPICQQNKAVCYECIARLHLVHEQSMIPISDFEKLVTQENPELASISDSQFQQSRNFTNQIKEFYQLFKEEISKAIDKWYFQVQQQLEQQSLSVLINQIKENKHTTDTIEQIMKSIKINNGQCQIRQKDCNQGLTMVINMINHSQSFCQQLNYTSKKLLEKQLELKNQNINSQNAQKVNIPNSNNYYSTEKKVSDFSFQKLDQDTQRKPANLRQIGGRASYNQNRNPIVSVSPNRKSITQAGFYPNQNQIQKKVTRPERPTSQEVRLPLLKQQQRKHFIKITQRNEDDV